MTIAESVHRAAAMLAKAKVESPQMEAVLLLANILKKSKEFVFAHPEHSLIPAHRRRFFALVGRRAGREPFAYITGHREFYGLDFMVNRNVLIPRPETETLVEAVYQKLHPTPYTLHPLIIDIGTGSGAIAITLAKLLPHATVYAIDNSAAALRMARKNAKYHNVHVHFKKGNLMDPIIPIFTFDPIGSKVKMTIIANLPYLTTAEWRTTQLEVKRYEPLTALDGGPDGLKYYRQLINQIRKLLVTSYQLRVTLYLEIDPHQTKPLTALIHKTFPNAHLQIKKDFSGRDRVLTTTLPSEQHSLPKSRSHQR